MAALEWDPPGDREFQTGLDRGVLYTKGKAVAWNGLTSLSEETGVTTKPYYQDGVKFLETSILGEFEGTLNAFSYPEEFDELQGVAVPYSGLHLFDQRPKRFDLSYRTQIGNDLGYEIHLLYNLLATPGAVARKTIGKTAEPVEFSWKLTSIPVPIEGHRPTSHIVVRSTDVHPTYFPFLENGLYGTESTPPGMVSPSDLLLFFQSISGL